MKFTEKKKITKKKTRRKYIRKEVFRVTKNLKKKLDALWKNIKKKIRPLTKKISSTKYYKKTVYSLRVINDWLSRKPQRYAYNGVRIILLLVGLYLVIYPIIPRLRYHFLYEGKETYPYESELVANDDDGPSRKEIPAENRLVIPAISVDMPIVEGSSDKVLDLGVWHRPGTGTPGNGNMVLTGHRVGYAFLPDDVKNSTSFYNLDKLKEGDFVIVYWGQQEYDYEITGFEIVDPDMMEVESQSVGERLTLYTCHPIGSNAQRLVYYAKRVEE